MKNKIQTLTQASMLAALYVVLTLIASPISFGPLQCRISEMLTIMPAFTPAAIPGLTIGCLLSNLLGGCDILDIIFGTIATGLAAWLSYLVRKHRPLVPIPPIICNALIVPFVLKYAYMETAPLPFLMLTVAGGELISCGILGGILLYVLRRYEKILFHS